MNKVFALLVLALVAAACDTGIPKLQATDGGIQGKVVLGVLLTDDHRIEMLAGEQETLYSVQSSDGAQLGKELSVDQLQHRFPGLFDLIRQGVAAGAFVDPAYHQSLKREQTLQSESTIPQSPESGRFAVCCDPPVVNTLSIGIKNET